MQAPSLAVRRALLSLLLIWHLVAVGAALALETAPGKAVRRYTRDYERLVGVYQNWNMFAPNPPQVDNWMQLTGTLASGEAVTLAPLVGARDDVWLELRYLRAGKLERNLLSEKRQKALQHFARQQCAQQPGLVQVMVTHVKRRTPTPQARRGGEAPALSTQVVAEVACSDS